MQAALIEFVVYLSHSPVLVEQFVVGPAVHVSGDRRLIFSRSGRGGGVGGRRLFACAVAGAQGPFGHQIGGHGLQIVGPSN